jgi:Family of unknown function (DUF5771)
MVTCPEGEYYRKSYTRKGIRFAGKCLRSTMRSTRRNGPGIGKLRKGELAKYGYSKVSTLSLSARHAALDKAIKEFGSLGVWRKLNAVYVYTRRTAPDASKIFKADRDWIRVTYGIKAF